MKLFRMVVVLYNFLLTRILPACHLSSRPWCWVLSYFSCVCLFVTPWTVASQAPLSMGFSRQEYWSGLACPPPGDLPNPQSVPMSLTSPALAGRFFSTNTTWEAPWFLLWQHFPPHHHPAASYQKNPVSCYPCFCLLFLAIYQHLLPCFFQFTAQSFVVLKYCFHLNFSLLLWWLSW